MTPTLFVKAKDMEIY